MDIVVAVVIGLLATWLLLIAARWTGSPAGYELLARLLGGSPGA